MNTISSVKWGWGLLTIGCLTGAMLGKGDTMEAPAVIARAEGQTERKERQQQEVRDIVKRLNAEKAAKKLASKAAVDSSTVAGA